MQERTNIGMGLFGSFFFLNSPSRLACLYTSKTLEEALNWASFFKEIGCNVYSVVKLQVDGTLTVVEVITEVF